MEPRQLRLDGSETEHPPPEKRSPELERAWRELSKRVHRDDERGSTSDGNDGSRDRGT